MRNFGIAMMIAIVIMDNGEIRDKISWHKRFKRFKRYINISLC